MTELPSIRKPYVLAVGSHKGGTGRTTTAATLAWRLAQPARDGSARRVVLWDADRLSSASLLAAEPNGVCRWPNVRVHRAVTPPAEVTVAEMPVADVVVADCPSLTETACQAVLAAADGVVITCLPDPLCLRTIPIAATAIGRARRANPRLSLLGLVIAQHRLGDALSEEMLVRLREHHQRFLLEPPIPYCPAMAEWAATPGRPPPTGPALAAYAQLAETLLPLLEPAREPSAVAANA